MNFLGALAKEICKDKFCRLFQIANLMHNSFILQQYVCYITILNSTVCRLRALHLHTVRLFTEGDDTRGCSNTICPPEDE